MAQALLVNPRARKRRRKSPAKKAKTRTRVITRTTKAAPKRRRFRKYRSNPVPSLKKMDLMGTVTNSVVQAGGALAADMATVHLPLPANLKTGDAKFLTRAAVAFGLGMVSETMLGQKKLGRQVFEGSATVIMHEFITQKFGQQVGLSSAYDVALEQSGQSDGNGMLGYEDNGMLGYEDNGMLGYNEFDESIENVSTFTRPTQSATV